MKYNLQTDSEWNSEIMTDGTDRNGKFWIDTIGRWGCLLTSIANIFQEHLGKDFTPLRLNDLLRGHKGYEYLYDKNTLEPRASFIVWSVIKDLFNIGVEKELSIKEYNDLDFFIARIETPYGGHYINVLFRDQHENLWCFDVETGLVKAYKNEITFLHKIIF